MKAADISARLERLLGAAGRGEAAPGGPAGLALPADAEQTAAVVRWARMENVALAIGGGAPGALGTAGPGAEIWVRLDLARLSRLRFHEPQDLTIGVEAGMTAGALEEVLASRDQYLPLDVASPERTRLGAILAAHRSGPLRQYYGTVRDFIIGIEFVSPAGSIVHGGGRVVKNVAGYDLMRLQLGAQGSLGVITAANFKVFPCPRGTETVRWRLASSDPWAQAEAARTRLLHSPLRPLAIELNGGLDEPSAWSVDIRYGGPEPVRDRYRRELGAIAAAIGAGEEGMTDDDAWWRARQAEPQRPTRLLLSAPSGAGVAALRAILQAAATHSPCCAGRLALGSFAIGLAGAPSAPELGAWRAAAARCHRQAWLRAEDEPIAAALAQGRPEHAWMGRLHAALATKGA